MHPFHVQTDRFPLQTWLLVSRCQNACNHQLLLLPSLPDATLYAMLCASQVLAAQAYECAMCIYSSLCIHYLDQPEVSAEMQFCYDDRAAG